MARKLIEKRRRGVLGWMMLVFFWIANGLMALWLAGTLVSWGKMAQPVSEAERAATDLGVVVALGVIFSIWACIAIVTGMLAYVSRGRKEIVEIES
jgi:hypothetical protein